jgi:hypothetical protein
VLKLKQLNYQKTLKPILPIPQVTEIVDLSHFEDKGQFLEGTGSIVFDYACKKAYACRYFEKLKFCRLKKIGLSTFSGNAI